MSIASFISFDTLSLQRALGIPSSKFLINGTTFALYVLPALVGHFIMAVLAITPRTRPVRLALWPIVALLALRAALSVDLSRGRTDQTSLNVLFVSWSFSSAVRTLDWAWAKEPLVRNIRPANTPRSTIVDAFDLVTNLRGLGWEWSRGLHVPRSTRPADRMAFIVYTFLSAVTHAMICGMLHRAILKLVPVSAGPAPQGSTIFDESLPFCTRYFRASILSTAAIFVMYATLQTSYNLGTILGILVFRQDPVQWPPVFDAPWCSTSLSDLWSRRWHQLGRHTFLVSGGYPLSLVLGRPGIIIGAFLSSGVLHHFGNMALNSQVEIRWMLGGFGMMGVGVLAEYAFYRITGKRVCGVAGRVWMATWLILSGNVIVEGFARAGAFRSFSLADSALPVRISVERLVEDLDAWLHAI